VSSLTSPAGPQWLVEQLPVGMLEDDFLVRFTSIFQDVADTLVDAVDTVEAAADLTLTPDPFVRWLGSWIDAYPNPGEATQPPGGARERAWIQAQARALTGRGTRPSLELMLQALFGDQPLRVSDGGGVYPAGQCPPGDPAWVQVELPALERVAMNAVLDLIRSETPVHVAVRVIVDGGEADHLGLGVPRPRGRHVAAIESGSGVAVEPGLGTAADPGLATAADPGLATVTDPGLATVTDPGLGTAADSETEAGLSWSVRRLPGTAGRARQPFRSCRVCAERNRVGETDCWRCGSAMDRPIPVPEPKPEPTPVVVEPQRELVEPRIWPVLLLVAAVVLVLVAILTGTALIR
jgi:phage tail-like protein